jgi:hypothetical protein
MRNPKPWNNSLSQTSGGQASSWRKALSLARAPFPHQHQLCVFRNAAADLRGRGPSPCNHAKGEQSLGSCTLPPMSPKMPFQHGQRKVLVHTRLLCSFTLMDECHAAGPASIYFLTDPSSFRIIALAPLSNRGGDGCELRAPCNGKASSKTSAAIASTMATARGTTHGSCLPAARRMVLVPL